MSAVLALRPTQPGSQRAFLGKAAHAFFLRLVSEADAELATALHDQSENRPFTVSTPMTLRMGRATGAPVAGYDQVLRITSYAPDLSRLLVQRALPRLPQRIALGDDVFSVRGVFVDRCKVMVLQVGQIRRDISYNGDTLNTAARIESMCNEYR
ncbi:MAG: hypothetical protein SVP26_04730, partial [Chloroflexota bacterium]|nr:hypothetical protein [Chloroflexota bacterium]